MARKPRIEYPQALYHVIARGNRQESIFLQPTDFSKYLALVKRYKRRYEFLLYAYALMVNHVHLLIEVDDVPLSKIMQGLQQTYTQFFNWKYGKTGHVFQGRYKALLCQKDAYLLELVRYIHLNPMRAEIAKNLSEYPWTSHRAYVHSSSNQIADKTFVLGLFHSNSVLAKRLYVQFLRDGLKKGHSAFMDNVHEGRILGKQSFVEGAYQAEKIIVQQRESVSKALSLNQICEVVCGHFAVQPEILRSNVKIRTVVRARRVFFYIARVHFDYSLKRISLFTGMDATAACRYIQDVDRLMRTDVSIRSRVDTIRSELGQKL